MELPYRDVVGLDVYATAALIVDAADLVLLNADEAPTARINNVAKTADGVMILVVFSVRSCSSN